MQNTQDEFSDAYIPTSNWMKFDKVGDNVSGYLASRFYKEGNGTMPDQEVFVLAKAKINGELQDGDLNVPIKATNTYILSRVKSAKIGQKIGFKYQADIEPSVKGHHPAKSIAPYLWPEIDQTILVKEEFGGTEVSVDQNPF